MTGFSAVNYIGTATGGDGTDAFTAWVIAIVRSVPAAAGILAGKLPGSTPIASGWGIVTNSSGVVTMQFRDSVGAKASPTSPLVVGDIGKIVMFHGLIDVANSVVRLFRTGGEVGAGTASVGSLVTGGTVHGIGSRNAGGNSSLAALDYVGHGYVEAVMSGAEIATHYAACVAAAKCVPTVVAGTQHNWDAADYAASWADEIAAQAMTTTGTLTTGTRPSPVWA